VVPVDDVLGGDGSQEAAAVSVEDLRRFSQTAQDLADPDVVEKAWGRGC
jgi:hypothetical protein